VDTGGDVLDDGRGESQRRFVENERVGIAHQRATDGEHLLFAAAHRPGVLLGALYEYSGSLLVPVLVHASWNAVVFGSEYVEAAGTVFG